MRLSFFPYHRSLMKIAILAVGEDRPDLMSGLIQWRFKTDYSHSAILIDDEWVYHATGKGFHAQRFIEVLDGHKIRHRIEFTLEGPDADFARGWLLGHEGQEYSTSQLIGFGLIGKHFRRFLSNGKAKLICSEAVGLFMAECLKINDPRLLECDWLAPRDITEIAYAARRD